MRPQLADTNHLRSRLLTVEQAAEYLNRTRDAMRHLVHDGKLPTVRADKRVFIDVEDLDAWIRNNKVGN